MASSEHELQVNCVNWFGYKYPKIKDLLFAVPNGGVRHKRTAAKLKAEGVRRGVPDLFLAISKHGKHGLFIEMKYGRNKQTSQQLRYEELLKSQNYAVAVCYTFDDFRDVIELYMGEHLKK
jgi:hypothetical protein